MAPIILMRDTFLLKGEFYLPSEPDLKIFGTLSYDRKEGTYLDLFGSFNQEDDEEEIIWGELENGKGVTLFNSFIVHKKFTNFEQDKYYSNFLFVNIHFDSKRDIKFNRLSVRYSHLDEWLNLRKGFDIDYITDKNGVKIEYKLPAPISYKVDDLEIKINLTAKGPSTKLVQKSVSITQKAFISFQTSRKRQFEKISDDINHFKNLLSLSIQKPIDYTELTGYLRIGSEKKMHECIILTKGNAKSEENEILPSHMLMPYQKVAKNFEVILTNWYSKKSKLETTLIPHMSVYRNVQIYESDKFLNLARAMEAFHRDFIKSKATNKQRYQEAIKSLSYSYNWLLKIRSIPKMAKMMKDYRNDLTHSNPVQIDLMKKYLKLYHLSENLKIINTCLIFNQLGLTKKEIKNLLDSSLLYTHLKYNVK